MISETLKTYIISNDKWGENDENTNYRLVNDQGLTKIIGYVNKKRFEKETMNKSVDYAISRAIHYLEKTGNYSMFYLFSNKTYINTDKPGYYMISTFGYSNFYSIHKDNILDNPISEFSIKKYNRSLKKYYKNINLFK